MPDPASSTSWTTWREALAIATRPAFLKKTIRTALFIGTVLFLINHMDEVVSGRATAGTYLKGLATCIVPFCVANWGILVATRKPRS